MAMTLITTNTISSATANVSFTTGIDSTYKLYIFKWYDLQGDTASPALMFQGNVAGQSGFNEAITSTSFRVIQTEADSPEGPEYTDYDLAQGTDYQFLTGNTGSEANESSSGTLHLFNPSNTTYVKHFYCRAQSHMSTDGSLTHFTAGYFNVTGAIDEIDFKMNTENIANGVIKMYGVG